MDDSFAFREGEREFEFTCGSAAVHVPRDVPASEAREALADADEEERDGE